MSEAKRNKWFDRSFLAFGLLVQIITFFVTNSLEGKEIGWLSLISGCLGVCSVVLTAQGNILFYAFGFGQVLTYTWLCITQRFYGEIAINAYYFVTMIYGVYVWRKRLQIPGNGEQESPIISPRKLSIPIFALITVLTLLGSWLVGWGLAAWTDDTQPYLDAFTTIPALVAQVLMILVYREHWFLWLAVDVVSVALWLRAGDYCMTAQYVFWTANCLYGLHRWRSFGISKV